MSSFGFGTLTVALFALVCCSGSDEKTFEVHMRLEKLIVKPKESFEVNCSTTCNQPEVGGLETSLNKILLLEQTQWKHYLISNISHDTVLWCHFTCSGKQKSMSSNVSVYQPPRQVFLTLQPTWVAVGKSFTIECRVPAVEPLDSLTLSLLRGSETLHSQTFGKAAPALQEATATFSSMAHREDGHHNFSCLAVLDLMSRGGEVFCTHSAPKMLEIYEPVPDSQMVIIVTVVSVLLFLFVTSVLLCFIFSQHWRQRRMGTYGVRAAWRRLPQAFRP
ncbi:intercellular adhesion molecule 2 [Papio anubis]|uniref:Intercellular adhesion molecule 2 n=1 Tax=Papio anubis TaxID=9555 RepID=A0A2I3MC57_PAPAN|nr:intercellular adhesion molecule 2 [Papio anubis]XP_009189266.1 intercellular adhesion molecule 2 [Papio anubis]XP_021784105.1 intercellular adhesion molecule 2 [Papio anubis]